MRNNAYLLVALAAFVATVGSIAVAARISIAGTNAFSAIFWVLSGVPWAAGPIIILFVPYVGVALLCDRVRDRAKKRSVLTIFIVGLAALGYFYLDALLAVQQAVEEGRRTAATLTIGFTPFVAGFPIMLVVGIAAELAAWLDRQPETEANG